MHLLQRKTTSIGKGLGKTSGWAHRAVLKDSGIAMVPGVRYDRIDDEGLHVTVGEGEEAETRVLDVDHVVVCAGQESVRDLYDELVAEGLEAHLVGGADVAAELDAKRAIEQGTRVRRRPLSPCRVTGGAAAEVLVGAVPGRLDLERRVLHVEVGRPRRR